MRTARIVEEGAAYYHVMSRVVDRRRVFSSNWEREGFRKIMRAVEAFCARNWSLSRCGFESCLESRRDDPGAKRYLRAIALCEQTPPGDDWHPTIELSEK